MQTTVKFFKGLTIEKHLPTLFNFSRVWPLKNTWKLSHLPRVWPSKFSTVNRCLVTCGWLIFDTYPSWHIRLRTLWPPLLSSQDDRQVWPQSFHSAQCVVSPAGKQTFIWHQGFKCYTLHSTDIPGQNFLI